MPVSAAGGRLLCLLAMKDSSEKVLLRREGAIARLMLNSAGNKNAIDRSMWLSIVEHCNCIETDNGIKVVVLEGAGDCFSGGADLKEMHQMLSRGDSLAPNYQAVDQSLTRLRQLSCPSIALIRGVCMGGGCMIALTADFRLAAQGSVFAITPARLGLTITPEQIQDLIQLVGVSRAKEMLYTGRRVDDQEALQWGLVNCLVNESELENQLQNMAAMLTQVSQHSVRTFKRVIREMSADHRDHELCEKLYRQGFEGPDFKEGADAFLERRPPKFPSNENG